MIEYKQGSARVPVRLFDSATGLPKTGVVWSDVAVAVEKADGTEVVVAITSPDWVELSTGSFSGSGQYTLVLPTAALSQVGRLTYAVGATGVNTCVETIKVIANEESETKTSVDRILDLTEGRWRIDDVVKQLVMYKPDGVTVLRRFDLFNGLGEPDVEDVFDRVPV
jgi:hypothetical protein